MRGLASLPSIWRFTLDRIPGRQPRPLSSIQSRIQPAKDEPARMHPPSSTAREPRSRQLASTSDQIRNSSYISAPGYHLTNPHPPLPLYSTVSGLVPNKLCEIVTNLCKGLSYLLKASFERRVLVHNFDSHFATQSDDWGPDSIINR